MADSLIRILKSNSNELFKLFGIWYDKKIFTEKGGAPNLSKTEFGKIRRNEERKSFWGDRYMLYKSVFVIKVKE